MPALTAGAILVTVGKIVTVISAINSSIELIRNIRAGLERIRETEIKRCWCNTTNADSNIFTQRMQELDQDIQRTLGFLDQYIDVLERSKREYENMQQQIANEASVIKSPGRR